MRGIFYYCSMKRIVLLLCLWVCSLTGIAQTQTPAMISNVPDYRKTVREDALKQMTDLKKMVPGIVLDLRYATKNNFTKHVLYRWAGTTFMRTAPAQALAKIQQALREKGYGIKVFDAYRPWSATKEMWDLVKDERYVADPSKGSNHNRGLAIDLTIVRLNGGAELNMGTGFDNFTDTAHHSFTQLPQEVLNNRKMLKGIMEQHGFKPLESEWWHYSWPDDRKYEVLNISLKKLWKGI